MTEIDIQNIPENENPPRLKGVGYFLGFFLVGIIAAYAAALCHQILKIPAVLFFLDTPFIPLLLMIVPYIYLLTYVVIFIRNRKSDRRFLPFSLGVLFKFSAFVTLVALAPMNSHVYRLVYTTPVGLLAGDSIYMLESIIMTKTDQTESGQLPTDFFNLGLPYKTNDGNTYSVGPDFMDSKMQIPYDPTNGIISGGDILVFRRSE